MAYTSVLTFVTDDEVDLAASLKMTYIIKPFSIHDLMDRINCIALRSEQLQRPVVHTLGRITVDMRRAVVSKDNNPIDMSLQDYDLFCFLATHSDQVFSREELMRNVWGYTDYLGNVRIVDVAIHRLRLKIEDDPPKPQFIKTQKGRGYFFAT